MKNKSIIWEILIIILGVILLPAALIIGVIMIAVGSLFLYKSRKNTIKKDAKIFEPDKSGPLSDEKPAQDPADKK